MQFNDINSIIAPADGKLLVYSKVGRHDTFLIKRNLFNLHHFLDDNNLADRFSNGTIIIIRLSLLDYHHFHFPDSGVPRQPIIVKGKYYAGGSYGLYKPIPLYTENFRMITLFDSDHFDRIAIVEIGAFTVGSIEQAFKPGQPVKKGDKKGYFELGGSTVVMLLTKGVIRIDEDLRTNTAKGFETAVRFGDKIGISLLNHRMKREVMEK